MMITGPMASTPLRRMLLKLLQINRMLRLELFIVTIEIMISYHNIYRPRNERFVYPIADEAFILSFSAHGIRT